MFSGFKVSRAPPSSRTNRNRNFSLARGCLRPGPTCLSRAALGEGWDVIRLISAATRLLPRKPERRRTCCRCQMWPNRSVLAESSANPRSRWRGMCAACARQGRGVPRCIALVCVCVCVRARSPASEGVLNGARSFCPPTEARIYITNT